MRVIISIAGLVLLVAKVSCADVLSHEFSHPLARPSDWESFEDSPEINVLNPDACPSGQWESWFEVKEGMAPRCYTQAAVDLRKAEIEKKAEEERKAEIERKAEEERKAEIERKAEEEREKIEDEEILKVYGHPIG